MSHVEVHQEIAVTPQRMSVVSAPPAAATRTPRRSRVPTRVPLDALLPPDSPRVAGIDAGHAFTLAGLDTQLSPILVQRSTMRVVDGAHRVRAARLRNDDTIEVEFFEGTDCESFVRAVEANLNHGLPLTLQDRRAAAGRIVRSFPEWSDRAVAAVVGLSSKTVATIRQGGSSDRPPAAVRVGRDGRIRPLNPAEGRLRAAQAVARNPGASLREIARMSGVSLGTARDVRERLRRGLGPLPDGCRGDRGPARSSSITRAESGFESEPAPDDVDFGAALDSLRRDPALRYSDEGRSLLRWLDSRAVRQDEARFVGRVPPHQAALIATVARGCAAFWDRVATDLERLGSENSEQQSR